MKGLGPLFLGIFATFAFSWVGLALVPNYQIGQLEPQSDEEGADVYPVPPSGMAERGRKIYTANGCFYCHSQQVRPDSDSTDIDRKWGERRSAPRDYVYGRPVLLGEMRLGPDLSNIGKRAPADDQAGPAPAQSPPAGTAAAPAAAGTTALPAPKSAASSASPPVSAPAPASPETAPSGVNQATSADTWTDAENAPPTYSAAWHHQHLYAPRSIDRDSIMPAFAFLYEKRRISGERSSDALSLTGDDAPPAGWEIVPTYEAKCLVAYLMSLDQSHPLKEVKSNAPPSPPAAGKAAAK
jgi:cbb3-type cytochrome oxidase cytochrome c subunit